MASSPAQAATRLPLHDPERLGALLRELEPRLTAVALRLTRDPDGAADVVQSAFEKVLRYGDGFRGQARVSTWLHRIVTTEALMWLRSRRRRREVQPGPAEDGRPGARDTAPTPLERLEQRERRQRLRRGLRLLSSEERDVVRCCALGGQSYAEYGARRGLRVGAVKSRAFRARRRLAEHLGE